MGRPRSRRVVRGLSRGQALRMDVRSAQVRAYDDTGHSVETWEILTERAYALSSYALTYVALRMLRSSKPTEVREARVARGKTRRRTMC